MARLIAFMWKALVGIVLCLTPVTAIFVAGWTSRAMQRAVFKTWYADNNGGNPENGSFAKFVRASPETRSLAGWPNWFMAEDLAARFNDAREAGDGLPRRMLVVLRALDDAFWANARAGLQMLLATWVVTLPLMVLWLLSWWGGWENSFNKGYEQAWVGPLVGVGTSIVFILAMTYVPLAQARLAAAGTWRAFFDYRLVRLLATRNALAMIRLAIVFALAGLVIAAARAGPLAIGNLFDGIGQWPQRDVMFLKLAYHIMASVLAFGLFVAVRLSAAKVYARALLGAVRSGAVGAELLSDAERRFLTDLRLLSPEAKDKGGLVARAVATSGRGIARLTTAALVLPLWFVFVAEIYIAQFLNHDWLAWVSHPLIQLPWMSGIRTLLAG